MATALLDTHRAALSAFHRAQDPLFAGVLPDHPRFAEVQELRARAYRALLRTRLLYWRHVHEHGCHFHKPVNTAGLTEGSVHSHGSSC